MSSLYMYAASPMSLTWRAVIVFVFLRYSIASAPAAGQLAAPDAFIFEVEDGYDIAAIYKAISQDALLRTKYDSDIMRGGSFQIKDSSNAPEKLVRIKSIKGLRKLWPVQPVQSPPAKAKPLYRAKADAGRLRSRGLDGWQRFTTAAHALSQVDKLRREGYNGNGLKIAVVDSGIDYKHPALGGCFGPGCLVGFGADLIGDDSSFYSSGAVVEDPDPMDCYGHGTHVAGIIAAQQNEHGFTGAAPNITLGAYRVTDCDGFGLDDIILAGILRAEKDGAHIINVSINGPFGWSAREPSASVIRRIIDKGVLLVVAAGNSGRTGLFYAGNLSSNPQVMSVGNFQGKVSRSHLMFSGRYLVDNGTATPFSFLASFESSPWANISNEMRFLDHDACTPLAQDWPDMGHELVLVRSGACSINNQTLNLASKAKHIFFSQNQATYPSLDENLPHANVTKAAVPSELGEAWIKALANGKKVSVVTHGQLGVPVPDNSTWTQDSTWGPTWEMDVATSFGVPGSQILSTYPTWMGSYAYHSGTSMAAPLLAGILSLVSQAHGSLDPMFLKNLLSSTAKPQRFWNSTHLLDYLAPVAQQGGGLVQAYDAAHTLSMLEPFGLSFNDSDHAPEYLNFTIRNLGHRTSTYTISHRPAVAMYTLNRQGEPSTFPNDAVEAAASLTFSQESVTLAPKQSKQIKVSAKAPESLDSKRLAVWSGWIAVNGSDDSVLSLPYQGLAGSLRSSPVLKNESRLDQLGSDASKRHFYFQYQLPSEHVRRRTTLGLNKTQLGLTVNSLHPPTSLRGPTRTPGSRTDAGIRTVE